MEPAPDFERIGKIIYGYQRLHFMLDQAGSDAVAQHGPDLASRLERLAQDYDAIMKVHGRADNVELDAVLHEVQVLTGEVTAWVRK